MIQQFIMTLIFSLVSPTIWSGISLPNTQKLYWQARGFAAGGEYQEHDQKPLIYDILTNEKDLTFLKGVQSPIYNQLLADVHRTDWEVTYLPRHTDNIHFKTIQEQNAVRKIFHYLKNKIKNRLYKSMTAEILESLVHQVLVLSTQTFDKECLEYVGQYAPNAIAFKNIQRVYKLSILPRVIYTKMEINFLVGNGVGKAPVGDQRGIYSCHRSTTIRLEKNDFNIHKTSYLVRAIQSMDK